MEESVCQTNGHRFYYSTMHIYAKDENGVAFKGGGKSYRTAAKFAMACCMTCTEYREISIMPAIEERGNPEKAKPSKGPSAVAAA